MYVIQRTDGLYVARQGSEHSYTRKLEDARKYRTRQEADNDRCAGNETVVAVADLLGEHP